MFAHARLCLRDELIASEAGTGTLFGSWSVFLLCAVLSVLTFGLAYAIVGEEKHTGTQDPGRGASRARLAAGVREWLHRWGYPWSERDGIICVDPLTHT